MVKASKEDFLTKKDSEQKTQRKVWDSNFDLDGVSDEKIKKPFLKKQLSFGQFLVSELLILLAGLLVIGLLYFVVNQDTLFKPKGYIVPITTQTTAIYLEVNNPEDYTLTFDDSIVVSGKTVPGASVVMASDGSYQGVEASSLGEFSKVFPLDLGVNTIQISVFDERGESQTLPRQVYYSKEKLDEEN